MAKEVEKEELPDLLLVFVLEGYDHIFNWKDLTIQRIGKLKDKITELIRG